MEEQSITEKSPNQLNPIDTVLVIDDDEGWCFLYKKILAKAGVGNKIISANNGLEALKILQTMAASGEKLPDLIFVDLKMPVMDGFGFLDEITTSNELDISQTKIFVCTSSFLAKDKERASLYPVSGFITKPLTQEILLNILA